MVAQCLPIFCVWSKDSVTPKLDDPIHRNVDLVWYIRFGKKKGTLAVVNRIYCK